MTDNKIPFHLLEFTPTQEGEEMGMTIEVQPEFERWFVKAHNLQEWDEDRFRVWFKSFLSDAVKDRLLDQFPKPMSEQQRVDIYSREGLDDGGE